MAIPSPDEVVKLKSQETVSTNGQRIEKLTLDVYAVNKIRAKQRARVWVRKEAPNARNLLNPETEETEQSTLTDFFTDSLDLEFREVEITVVRPSIQ